MLRLRISLDSRTRLDFMINLRRDRFAWIRTPDAEIHTQLFHWQDSKPLITVFLPNKDIQNNDVIILILCPVPIWSRSILINEDKKWKPTARYFLLLTWHPEYSKWNSYVLRKISDISFSLQLDLCPRFEPRTSGCGAKRLINVPEISVYSCMKPNGFVIQILY